MKRKMYQELLNWKNNEKNKPLILLGARQVGKTYIVREFCRENFKNFIEINLFQRSDIVDMYKETIDSEQKFINLKALVDFDLEKEDTVLFIDEIQESEELISELKYFCEAHNNINIICAGSLLGVKLNVSKISFPVGKVWMKTLYPLDFEEFLWAFNEQILVDEIKKHYNSNTEMSEVLHKKALEYYKLFLVSGGMPESVLQLVNVEKDIVRYDTDILTNIVLAYFKDMHKHVKNDSETLMIESVYNSIPTQLANLSGKFQYSKIAKNARLREYESCLNWLIAANLTLKSSCIKIPSIPLELYKKDDTFKLYLSDVGILNSLLKIRPKDIIFDNLGDNKGIISENYVANALISNGYDLYYWKSDYDAEVDFVIYKEDGIIPVEVKYGDNTQSKSLNIYIDKFNPNYSIRISTKNFGFNKDKKIKSVPLYAVFMI